MSKRAHFPNKSMDLWLRNLAQTGVQVSAQPHASCIYYTNTGPQLPLLYSGDNNCTYLIRLLQNSMSSCVSNVYTVPGT